MACVLCATTPAVARLRADLSLNFGAGRPTGKGTDEFDLGSAMSVGGGVWFHPNLSVEGQFHRNTLNIDTAERYEASGALVMLSVVPWFHAFGDDAVFDLRVGPMFGLGSLAKTRWGHGNTLKSNTRGYHLGAQVAALISFSDTVSFGPWVMYALVYRQKACFRVDDKPQVCSRDVDPGSGQPVPRDDDAYFSAALAAHFVF